MLNSKNKINILIKNYCFKFVLLSFLGLSSLNADSFYKSNRFLVFSAKDNNFKTIKNFTLNKEINIFSFISPYCYSCVKEIIKIQNLKSDVGKYLVSYQDYKDTIEYLNNNSIRLPVFFVKPQIIKTYNIQRTPSTIITDIKKRIIQYSKDSDVIDGFSKLTDEKIFNLANNISDKNKAN